VAKKIEEVEFTVFDTETTGLEPESGDRIVEIAGIRVRGQEVLGVFETLVNPGRPISEAAFRVNNISAGMLEGAPAIGEVLPKFLHFAQDSCLCSYNAGFDLGFINQELRRLGKGALEGFTAVDILKMARRLLPGLNRYALWFVAEQLQIKEKQSHRALSDVELTLGVFHKLKEILYLKGITEFEQFLGLFAVDAHFLEGLNAQKLSRIQEAIDLGVGLKIKYIASSGAKVSEREVLPKELRQENERSYLVAFCRLRNEERTFRVDGILHLEIV
jgi:DNA polymerase III epsilon subunit family exonuclease